MMKNGPKSMKFVPEKNISFMLQFRTPLPGMRAAFQINHQNQLFVSGSCFAEHIGAKLSDLQFRVMNSPFGIVYNPYSILEGLERVATGGPAYTGEDVFEQEGIWRSWQHHSRFALPEREETVTALNRHLQEAHQTLLKTDRMLLTFGTADVFYLKDNQCIVANNHKMPADHFGQRRLSAQEIAGKAIAILTRLKQERPSLQVILTVSPVRHLRAGAVENQRSKAQLILACEALSRELPFVSYFPAYELLLDDLRDYRFYAADMLHPSELAVSYIWQYFAQTYFSAETQSLIAQIEKVKSAAAHRPFHSGTAAHQKFVAQQLEAIQSLQNQLPEHSLQSEMQYFMQQKAPLFKG
jgi:hypothetical protein